VVHAGLLVGRTDKVANYCLLLQELRELSYRARLR
jgi:hypothetical protein